MSGSKNTSGSLYGRILRRLNGNNILYTGQKLDTSFPPCYLNNLIRAYKNRDDVTRTVMMQGSANSRNGLQANYTNFPAINICPDLIQRFALIDVLFYRIHSYPQTSNNLFITV